MISIAFIMTTPGCVTAGVKRQTVLTPEDILIQSTNTQPLVFFAPDNMTLQVSYSVKAVGAANYGDPLPIAADRASGLDGLEACPAGKVAYMAKIPMQSSGDSVVYNIQDASSSTPVGLAGGAYAFDSTNEYYLVDPNSAS